MKKITLNEFIEKAKKIHGEKYDYSKSNYIGINKKLIIICHIHGEFKQFAGLHLKGANCQKCNNKILGKNRRKTLNTFIQESNKIHNFKYDYSKITNFSLSDKINIICSIHGDFTQRASDHLNGNGCQKCKIDKHIIHKTKTSFYFIAEAIKIHQNRYDYSITNYIKGDLPIQIICKIHGIFHKKASNHLRGHGCLKCTTKSSRELKIISILDDLNIPYIMNKTFDDLYGNQNLLRYDFWLPTYNKLIEYDGVQHYHVPYTRWNCPKYLEKFSKIQKYDFLKNEYARKNNINLLRIPYIYYRGDDIKKHILSFLVGNYSVLENAEILKKESIRRSRYNCRLYSTQNMRNH